MPAILPQGEFSATKARRKHFWKYPLPFNALGFRSHL
jgi:hypothetical protein